ncbi:MAG: type II toxin-antitoxin system RelE/ParE family toxin [Acidimicrobiaceae bacterium]|nr:type II toxin-antitoxin system RelE/ParE family toxin [Acidimicrobiaceae bacterium]MDE0497499.1 type II toxin-antitoxin system RelE/ParE family toxin [Acidimicrobiaceae bacterium]
MRPAAAPQTAAASTRRNWIAEAPAVASLGVESQVARRLSILNAAESMNTLGALPSNHLEALKGDRRGRHSIRINRQWRVCFVWEDGLGPTDVEIVDYH